MPDYQAIHPGWEELTFFFDGKTVKLMAPSPKSKAQIEASIEWMRDKEMTAMLGADIDNDHIDAASETDRLQEIAADLDEYNWMIYRDGEVVGNVGLNAIAEQSAIEGKPAARNVILLGRGARGQGIAREVMKQVEAWAFHSGRFDTIVSRIRPYNSASHKLSAALGYRPYKVAAADDWDWYRKDAPKA